MSQFGDKCLTIVHVFPLNRYIYVRINIGVNIYKRGKETKQMKYKKLIMEILDTIDSEEILKQIYIFILHFVS